MIFFLIKILGDVTTKNSKSFLPHNIKVSPN